MTKCKKKNCSNEVSNGKKYCKYHLAQREDKGNKLIGASALVMGGIGLFKKIKR